MFAVTTAMITAIAVTPAATFVTLPAVTAMSKATTETLPALAVTPTATTVPISSYNCSISTNRSANSSANSHSRNITSYENVKQEEGLLKESTNCFFLFTTNILHFRNDDADADDDANADDVADKTKRL